MVGRFDDGLQASVTESLGLCPRLIGNNPQEADEPCAIGIGG